MKVIQLLPTISFGDAVSNDAIAIKKIIADMGYETGIFAENIDPRLPKDTAVSVNDLPVLQTEDVIIYHGSTGTELNYKLPHMGGRKVMIYHNITPSEFFEPYSLAAAQLTREGLDGIRYLADKLDYCIADSDYNKQDLLKMGFNCPIDVCPIIIPFSDYEKEPDAPVIKKYRNDGITNLLFVGRIAPNKKQEDIISSFYYYHKYYNPQSRLFLVGSSNGMENYHNRLCRYIQQLGIEDAVIFPGHIKFSEILAYYTIADAFICMSEHEGFGVPLVEAMFFKVPIIAYKCAAVPFTMGNQGALLETKEPSYVAAVIDRVVSDEKLKFAMKNIQAKQLELYAYNPIRDGFMVLLKSFLNNSISVKKPRIIQLSSTISRGDAVSNDIRAFQKAFIEMGYASPIYTEISPKGNGWENIRNIKELKSVSKDDVVLYHHATGTTLANYFIKLPARKVLVYHNVTPPSFFAAFDKNAEKSCAWGLKNLKEMQPYVDGCIADSEFNRQDLRQCGYDVPIWTCPILVPFSDYEQEPDPQILRQLQDGKENIVFVGRVAPNKKFEDVIYAFAEYKKMHQDSRLYLVGSYDTEGAYYKYLTQVVRELNVLDVYFSGHISFAKILAYYRAADLFLCMSEHEGFCVPLLEAMFFNVPIIAFRSTAIPETLGDAGVLLNTKDPRVVAGAMEKILTDDVYREQILEAQRKRLQCFSYENVNEILYKIILEIMESKDER